MRVKKIFIPFFLLTFVVQGVVADEVTDWMKRLGDDDIFVRLEAIQALGELADDRAIEPLIRALDDQERIIRYSACRSLGLIGGEKVTRVLIDLTKSPDPDRKQMAIVALGMVDDDTTLDLLLDQIMNDDPLTRWAGVVALGMLGDPRAIPLLKEQKANDRYYIKSTGRYPIREAAEAAIESITSSIDWHRSLNRGMELARLSDKPLLVYFYIWWDQWSKLMEGLTLADKEVVELSKKFVCVKINAYNELTVSERYDVGMTPTIICLDPNQKEIIRASGFVTAETLKGSLRQALDQIAEYSEVMGWWAQSNRLMDRGRFSEAIPYLQKIIAKDPENSSGVCDDARFVLAYCYGRRRNFKKAVTEFRKLLEEYPDYKKSDKVLYCLGLSYLNLGRYEEGIEALEAIGIRFPDSKVVKSADHLLTKLKGGKKGTGYFLNEREGN